MGAAMTPETSQEAARRLSAHMLAKGYEQIALHCYTSADGAEIYHRIRLRHPAGGAKWIRPMHANGNGYALGEPDFGGKAKPLYRLHELAASDPSSPVWWVEGE